MSTIYYYPILQEGRIEEHPFFDLMYDLELINPPHTQYKSNMSLCPAMNVNQTHTYLIRSPVDLNLTFNEKTKVWASASTSKEISDLLVVQGDNKPYLQLSVFYLFWSEKKSNTQLWMHDVPLHEVNEIPTWYLSSGMFPVGEYVRNTSLGFILKPNQTKIKIQREQPIAALTLIDNQKVNLVKKKPPQHIIDANYRNTNKSKFCPYLATKTLFSRWL